ncbi:MAG TPA: sigma-70 family RNA polymerase sigma factor [Pyrinomonadaceae bacterium]|nr:sigma-70 family RNA polymerase sigma factor [Pyrinomonadaceae bacterium]
MPESILKRIATGDRNAVEDCLNSYGGLVYSIARKLLANEADAEDAVQEAFIDVWKNAGRFDPTVASEATFIAMITRRRVIDRIRHSGRRISTDPIEDMVQEPGDRGHKAIEVNVEANEAAEAMRALRPEQQQVLRLSIVDGMSHQEIADLTGIPLGTVKTHARRGLLRVREALGLGSMLEFGGQKEAAI